jgi:hypothetical protein
MSKKSLQDSSILQSKKILDTSIEVFNNYSQIKDKNNIKFEIESEPNIDTKKAKIIIPDKWIDPLSAEGRTQGPQISFLKEGLEQNGFVTEIIQLKKDSLILNIDILEPQLVFIWSLTYFDPNSEIFKIFYSPLLQESKQFMVVGVITANPDIDLINRYRDWRKILKKVLFYEEQSEYKKILDTIFEVVHMQIIQLTPDSIKYQKDFDTTVHASCLLKFNRIAWLLVLRYICTCLEISYFIRLISNALSYKNIRSTYISNELIVEERIKYGFGFVMLHRNYKVDANLIGSFWDYYRLGIIPLVQMQNIEEMASYMIPYLDYFPFESDIDLFAILKASKNDPNHFNKLRLRILDRLKYEFKPETVVKNVLVALNHVN